jgi:hypothetical protein
MPVNWQYALKHILTLFLIIFHDYQKAIVRGFIKQNKKAGQNHLLEKFYPAFAYRKRFSIFLSGLFCGNNRNNRPVYHHGVQKVPEYLCRMWHISRETSAAGLSRRFCFRSCCLQMYSAFWLHGTLRNALAHWYSRGMRIALVLQR